MDLDGVAAESALRVDGVVAPMEPQPIEAGVAGRVASVHCDAGMHVEAGRLCAEIDPRPYRAAVAQRSGETRTAEARLEALRATLDRTRAALQRAEARGAGGRTIGRLRRSVERQQAGVEREEADVTRLRTARAAAESALAQTRIVVPVEGRIRSRDIEPGREVSAKAPLFVVAPDQARVTAALDTAQSGRIAVGDKAIFTVDALPGQAFYGKVTKIAPARNGEAATMDMTASDPRRMLKPGMAATARIFAR
nr:MULTISPECIES: efflux RND transporter periplasmic adaptor subunit [Methylosinus]